MADQVRVAGATGEPDLTASMPDVGAAAGPSPAGAAPSTATPAGPVAPPAGMDAQFVEAIVKLPFIVMGHRRMRFPLVGELGGDPEIWYISDREAEVAAIPAKVYLDRMLATTGISGTLAGLVLAFAMLVGPRVVADVIAQSERARAAARQSGPRAYTPATPPPSQPVAQPAPVPPWAPPAPAVVPETKAIVLPTGETVTVQPNREAIPTYEEFYKK
jgi:hypothetical protein